MGDLNKKAEELLEKCREKGVRIASAESCTGGMISSILTESAGSSDVFERGFITYSNKSKTEQINVPAALIARKGAVSKEVALRMASGALENSEASITVAVTGIAGPDGGTDEKPVGLVHIASDFSGHDIVHEEHMFKGDRAEVRKQTVEAALDLLARRVASNE